MTTNITIPTEITNREDIIDSRDVIARIEWLESFHDDCEHYEDHDDDEHDEYEALTNLAEEADGYAADWKYGETLIRGSYFQEYAEQLAEDIGEIHPADGYKWPHSHIDWEAAAEALKQDYTPVGFDGVEYWIR
jgi:hypothetical protein